jgi:phosphocarrier protein FPr
LGICRVPRTHDLTQYALAADRNNDAVASIGDTFDPVLLQLIRATSRGAAASQAAVSVCGEFAADERAASLLVGLGVTALSVTPPAIPATKEAVSTVNTVDTQRIAEDALVSDSAAAVRARLSQI